MSTKPVKAVVVSTDGTLKTGGVIRDDDFILRGGKVDQDIVDVPTEVLLAAYNKMTGKETKAFKSREIGVERFMKTLTATNTGQYTVLVNMEALKIVQEDGKAKYRKFHSDAIITVLVDENPKREGTASHARFANYKTGMTVADFLKTGGTPADVRWDCDHGYISLEVPEEPVAE